MSDPLRKEAALPDWNREQGTFANVGMYAAGIPVGLFIDSRGPRPGVLFGAITMGVGYFALHRGTEY